MRAHFASLLPLAALAALACSGAPPTEQAGESTSAITYPQPIIASISPTSGYGGQTVTVCGSNFASSVATGMVIKVDGVEVDEARIECPTAGCCSFWMTPANLNPSSEITVQTVTAAGSSLQSPWTSKALFTWKAPYILPSSLAPTKGHNWGGDSFDFTGNGLTQDITSVFFHALPPLGSNTYYQGTAACSEDGTLCTGFTPSLNAADQATVFKNGLLAFEVLVEAPGSRDYSNTVSFEYDYTPMPASLRVTALSDGGAPATTALWDGSSYQLAINLNEAPDNGSTQIALSLPPCITSTPASPFDATPGSPTTTVRLDVGACTNGSFADIKATVNGAATSVGYYAFSGNAGLVTPGGLTPGQSTTGHVYFRNAEPPPTLSSNSASLTFSGLTPSSGLNTAYAFAGMESSSVTTGSTATMTATDGALSVSGPVTLGPPELTCTTPRTCCAQNGCVWTTKGCSCE